MENKKGFIKVRAAKMMKDEYRKERHSDGTFTPTDEFLKMVNKQEAYFREKIITHINDVIPYNWGVYFTPFTDTKYEARIYCETNNEYDMIVNIIKDKIDKELIWQYMRYGTVNDIDSQF